MIVIRKAREGDVESIMEISKEMKINEKLERVAVKAGDNKEYRKRIKEGNFVYVIEDNKKIIGFCAAYGFDEFRKFDFTGNWIIKFLLLKPELFVYVDIIYIEKKYRKQKIGKAVMQIFMDDARKKKYEWVYVAVPHKPRNIGAIKLMEEFGFVCREEVERGGVRFGIYDKKL